MTHIYFQQVLDEQQKDPLLYLSMVMTDPPMSINTLNNRRQSVREVLPPFHATNASTSTSSIGMFQSQLSDTSAYNNHCIHCGSKRTQSDDEVDNDNDCNVKSVTQGIRKFDFDMNGHEDPLYSSAQSSRTNNNHHGPSIHNSMKEQNASYTKASAEVYCHDSEEMHWTKFSNGR